MLSFLSNTRVYLAAGATDLRKSFDTLAGVVRNSLRLDPLSGHLFVFTNARKNRLKIMFWDKTGWWVCAKRLEVGTLAWPASPNPSMELSSEGRNRPAIFQLPTFPVASNMPRWISLSR